MGRPEYLKEIMDPLFERFWAIGINKTSKNLYTSDNPVVYYSRKEDNKYSMKGFLEADLFTYPLNGNLYF